MLKNFLIKIINYLKLRSKSYQCCWELIKGDFLWHQDKILQAKIQVELFYLSIPYKVRLSYRTEKILSTTKNLQSTPFLMFNLKIQMLNTRITSIMLLGFRALLVAKTNNYLLLLWITSHQWTSLLYNKLHCLTFHKSSFLIGLLIHAYRSLIANTAP